MITLCAAGANTVYTGLSFAVIVVAHRSGASPAAVGLMLGAAGVGGLVGALVAPRLIAALPPGVLVLGVLWSGATLIPAMAAHPTPAVIGPLLAGFTGLMPAANAVLVSREMAATPEDMQGRVFTSVLFLSGAGGAAVPVLAGVLLDAVGDAAVLLALGAAMALVSCPPCRSNARRPRSKTDRSKYSPCSPTGVNTARSIPDLIIAATAELAGLTVLHVDKDFEIIAGITGQPLERLASV